MKNSWPWVENATGRDINLLSDLWSVGDLILLINGLQFSLDLSSKGPDGAHD
jgi:hypothetical protein